MTILRVDAAAGLLHAFDTVIPCALGQSGAVPAASKREGDGKTPLGRWPLRTVLLRPDRVALPAGLNLPWRWLGPDDGWSDGPADPAYNRPIRHPHDFSAERLWRDDGLYDVVVTLGHNDSLPMPGLGSAIFLHCRGTGPTLGCVAIDRDALLALLPRLGPGDMLEIA